MHRRFVLPPIVACVAVMTLTACGQSGQAAGGSPSDPAARPAATAQSTDSKTLLLAACLRDRGWEVSVGADGLGVNYPSDQHSQFQTDQAECEQVAGIDPNAVPTVSADEARWLYAEFLRVAPCVEGMGITVASPPSEGAFVEQLTAHPVPRWHPYDEAGPRLADVTDRCPIHEWPGG